MEWRKQKRGANGGSKRKEMRLRGSRGGRRRESGGNRNLWEEMSMVMWMEGRSWFLWWPQSRLRRMGG